VRSIAMIFSPQINGLLELAALISTACAHGKRPPMSRRRRRNRWELQQFHEGEPILQMAIACRSGSPG
jgi:hypothetical protein